MNIPVIFIAVSLFFRHSKTPTQYSKEALIDECKRLGAPCDGTSRILRHRISRLKSRL